jgi:putative PIN family toxin of toxin-antitoxin system
LKVVLDTNVLVSGLMSPHGPPGQIVRWLAAGFLRACYGADILTEYREVLHRPAFGFKPEHVEHLLRQITRRGYLATAMPVQVGLPDPDDEPFLGVAATIEGSYLVTGNTRHYPESSRQGVRVVTPAAFVEACRTEMRGVRMRMGEKDV